MIARKGATPEAWQRFQDLGLGADLLPIVADIGLPVHPDSKLKPGNLGKIPTRLSNGFIVGIPGWTTEVITPAKVKRWSAQPEHGICVVCRHVKAIDIDIDNRHEAQKVRDIVTALLGELPARTRSTNGRMVLMMRLTVPTAKRVIQTPHGAIELLGERQQFVASSTHKDGSRYEWTGPCTQDGLPTEIPEVTSAELDALWDALKTLAIPGGVHEITNGANITKPRAAGDASPDPVADFLFEQGLVLDQSSTGALYVECPWKDAHSSDNGDTQTAWFPAGVGGIGRGGFHCMHAVGHGQKTTGDFITHLCTLGYDEATLMANEFDKVLVELPDGSMVEPPADPMLHNRDKRTKKFPPDPRNLALALAAPHFVGVNLRRDSFLEQHMWFECDGAGRPTGVVRPVDEKQDFQALRIRLQDRGLQPPSMREVISAIDHKAWADQFDSARDWLSALPAWDRKPRIDTMMHQTFGTEDTPYAQSIGRYLFTALAGRVMSPGCQADMAIILVGAQGTRKTTAVRNIAPTIQAFTEIDLAKLDNVETARSLAGCVVGELSEMKGMRLKEVEHVKGWITRREEKYRDLYVQQPRQRPRRCIFIGTANDEEQLNDPTGARRWLPIHSGPVNAEWVAENRDQLWAEGLTLYREHGILWQKAEILANAEHHKFEVTHPWEHYVDQWITRRGSDEFEVSCDFSQGVAMATIFEGALGKGGGHQTKQDQMIMGGILRKLGWEKKQVRRANTTPKLWFPSSSLDVPSDYC